MSAQSRPLKIIHLGRISYEAALTQMEATAQRRAANEVPDTLYLLEHDPVFTLGRRADPANILADAPHLKSQDITIHETGRGGDVTYHGPGQIVGYPVLDLKPDRKDVRKYVTNLEELMIRVSQSYGLQAGRIQGLIGAWIDGKRKIGAIGVRISRWITTHGFAFNVAPNMDHFKLIIPCGIQDKGVTSLEQELGQKVPMEEAMTRIQDAFCEVLGYHE